MANHMNILFKITFAFVLFFAFNQLEASEENQDQNCAYTAVCLYTEPSVKGYWYPLYYIVKDGKFICGNCSENYFNSLNDFVYGSIRSITSNIELPGVGLASFSRLNNNSNGYMLIGKEPSAETINKILNGPILHFEGYAITDPETVAELTFNPEQRTVSGYIGRYSVASNDPMDPYGTCNVNVFCPSYYYLFNIERHSDGKLFLSFCESDPLVMIGVYLIEDKGKGDLIYFKRKEI